MDRHAKLCPGPLTHQHRIQVACHLCLNQTHVSQYYGLYIRVRDSRSWLMISDDSPDGLVVGIMAVFERAPVFRIKCWVWMFEIDLQPPEIWFLLRVEYRMDLSTISSPVNMPSLNADRNKHKLMWLMYL